MSQKKSQELQGTQENSPFKDTLNLPRTDFPIRADAKVNDPIMLKRWQEEDLYIKSMLCHEGAEKFILHDGPPYANGNIHLGHAYNKILKDIVTKSHRMMGYHTPVIPGWDCHGLPIELKVTQENPGISGIELKKACRDYALRWINIQREEFKRLGVIMSWQTPYSTMDPSYESYILTAFARFVERGYIERKNKTIPWCMYCQTTLATAEIEYENRKDPSIYVLFQLDKEFQNKIFPNIKEPVSLLVWTTTPWTLPLNRAVLIKEDAEYQVITLKDKNILIGAAADRIAGLINEPKNIVATVSAQKLAGGTVSHPFIQNLQVPIIVDQSVGLDEGTAIVHCAPGCGPIDYETGVKNNLEIYSPISADGRYTDAIEPKELAGMLVTDGQIWVIKRLAAAGTLFHKTSINHSYPHCWRCHNGLIFRATPQWFCDLEHNNLKNRALAAADKITYIPEQGKSFLRATLENRWEWCLSRQRAWGVPIPALIHKDNKQVYITADFIHGVAKKVADEGIEYWDRISLQGLINDKILPSDFPITEYRKETDIIDVWFESGVSHWAVLSHNPTQQFPADFYLEGIDQYRAWFQSSLLTSMILHDKAPMKTIMSHGFTVDAKGHKMSKSLGNVVAPDQIIERLGTDGLRLWVASIGNDGDAVVSEKLLVNVEQVLRKIRNTCRFLLQNLYDYDHERDAIALNTMKPFDQYALHQLYELQEKVLKAYRTGDVTAIFHHVADYCSVDISAFYGDIAKDTLYCDKADGIKRRSTQTAFWHILDALTRMIAPVMSFTAEQVSDFYQKNKRDSIHLQKFADLSFVKRGFHYPEEWERLKEIRSAILKLIELQREQGVVKHSLEARVELYYDKLADFTMLGKNPAEFLKEFFIVSEVVLRSSSDDLEKTALLGLFARVEHAQGEKCPRCWNWDTITDERGLCRRCVDVIK